VTESRGLRATVPRLTRTVPLVNRAPTILWR
jgi:hypothetical protein